MDYFVRPVESYRRNYNLIGTYVENQAFYLHKMSERPMDECVAYVKKSIGPGGRRELKIPAVGLLQRNKVGDREKVMMPLTALLQDIQSKREILSPSLTAYVNPDIHVSSLAKYIVANLKRRSDAKKKKFLAEMDGDTVLAAIYESAQTTLKIKNNSLSGAQCSPYTILWNKTAHSTLTSVCRCATSYGNANNERFLMGNRHYWSPDITRNNIVSMVYHTDISRVQATMERYGLQVPTHEQTMALVRRSTSPYWRSVRHLAEIEQLVSRLSDYERAAFLFTSNLYDLAEVNPDFVRNFLGRMSVKNPEPLDVSDEEALKIVKGMDADLEAYISMLCSVEMDGRSMKKVTEEDPLAVRVLAQNVKQAQAVLDDHGDFIQTFWVTDHLPPSIYHLPSIIRRTALVSDTDSTIFTVAHWADWYLGKPEFSPMALSVANTVVYFAGQTVRHIMASLAGNMGVHQKDIFRLAMKNEYFMPVFVMTGRAKHYFAYISAQEGNVFKKMKLDIKGVGLRNSNVPVALTAQSHALMRYLMDTVMNNDLISLQQVVRKVGQIEQSIVDAVGVGRFDVLKSMQIKTRESYKAEAKSSNFDHYVMWEEVFAPKYGSCPAPPYRAIKIPLNTKNAAAFKEWVASIKDRELAARLNTYYTERGKKEVGQLMLPEDVLNDKGIPEEVASVMDIRSTVAQLMEGFYITLECIGYMVRNDNNTRLAMDETELLSADWDRPEIELAA